MAYNFLYIDDEQQEKIDGTISGLKCDELNITFSNPDPSWDEQIKILIEGQNEIDGIILDLRLQEEVNQAKGGKANYRGSTLAQELRTLSKEKLLKDLPIILLSATEQIDKSFDSTGIDLFDLRIVKDQVQEKDYPIFQRKLIAIAKAYINAKDLDTDNVPENLKSMLGNTKDLQIDFRLLDVLSQLIIAKHPFHQTSKFILKEIVCKPGVLINERYLAARLGVNIADSPDWEKLINLLDYFRYNGFFHDAWKRWWASELPVWWKKNVSKETDLQSLNAKQRVDILKEIFQLANLVPDIKLPKCSSSNFWVVCQGTSKPIAIIDGFRTAGGLHSYPWVEQHYVSIDAALERTNILAWKGLSPLEKERLEQVQKFYTRERK
ncbi:hypothetical protein ACFOWM_09050 [Ferruginibacter yonginensis]|uniref:Response regulator receiver domain-containing protein n=1 Tax=Ferruginibacter yonginensis TaxID=1310416 RepID=A0ABV8QUE9_9BACT